MSREVGLVSVRDETVRKRSRSGRKATVSAVLAPILAREAVAALAKSLDRTEREVHGEVAAHLGELVVAERPWAAGALRPLLWLLGSRPWLIRTGSAVPHGPETLACPEPAVFVVAHRSYVDALVVNRVLNRSGLAPSYIFTGDNLRFWPLGPLGRRSNLVFMRRHFPDDACYKVALRLYISHLLREGKNLMFAIEGGRSRDGSLQPPRLGLLRYVLDAIDEETVPGVSLVPVALTYEYLFEATALVGEQAGTVKPAEDLGALLRLAWAHRRRRGAVDVRFGEPLRPARRPAPGSPEDDAMATALRLCAGVNDVTPITPMALVAMVLLGSPGRSWTVPRLRERLAGVLEFVRHRKLPVAVPVEHVPTNVVREWLEHLIAAGVIERDGAGAAYRLPAGRRRLAAYYRNMSCHWFLPRALAEIALLRAAAAEPEDRDSSVAQEIESLAKIFACAVTGLSPEHLGGLAEKETDLVVTEWRELSAMELSRRLRAVPCLFAPLVLRHVAEGFSIVAARLALQAPAVPVDEAMLIRYCLLDNDKPPDGDHRVLPESVSLPLFSRAATFLRAEGLFARDVDPASLREQRRDAETALTALRDEIAALTVRSDEEGKR
ncbi:hypothetical protein BS329_16985 [Amycolatopsis coloradensis]|uniref:Phospholipid/glycerol acyltransferase domain-containing protein n=1 Tax=Amycolatopsis coloradensis TaxID=76021 RepID=A0A1R0KTU5_9PSEU|nr:1-acyl-sn-glycerol-3-phosphate acyltransferase [Amycolatopsis coloradensis]OLZ51475.1 hypothetical protein BS329_16985 [Amycolatopsis coloradensis]